MFDLNPIDVLKKREVKIAPPHFKRIKLTDSEVFDGNIKKWIQDKLKGRYFITKIPNIEKDEKLRSSVFVGLEEEKEMTYFLLACPYLRRN